jgi:hypothetical protein
MKKLKIKIEKHLKSGTKNGKIINKSKFPHTLKSRTDGMLLSASDAHGRRALMLFPWKIFDTIEIHIMA